MPFNAIPFHWNSAMNEQYISIGISDEMHIDCTVIMEWNGINSIEWNGRKGIWLNCSGVYQGNTSTEQNEMG